MQKYKSIYFLAGVLFIPLLIAGYYFLATGSGKAGLLSVEAKSKSKWQHLLEKNNVDISYWKKYLPYVRRSEYDKAMNAYNVSKNNGGTNVQASSTNGGGSSDYPVHNNIKTTYFWAGEDAGGDNYGISNNSSCWDENWDKHCKNENQFYFALPYNDLDDNGNRKKEAMQIIPWANEKNWNNSESMCKNRWIKVVHGGKTAYAQWEDAGPCDDAGGCGENDKNYVFGTAGPKFKVGLDVSPAVKDYLGLDDEDVTSWQFINQNDVPAGPWSKVITTSGIYWK